MLNSICIAGRLTDDASLKYINDNLAVCNFTIANNRKLKNDEKTIFIEVVLYGPYAASLHPHLKKATAIDVVGELSQDTWQVEDKTFTKHKIIAKEIDFRIPKSNSNNYQEY